MRRRIAYMLALSGILLVVGGWKPHSRFPSLSIVDGSVWGLDTSGNFSPIPVKNGRIAVGKQFNSAVAEELRAFYRAALQKGWSNPIAEEYADRELTIDAPVKPAATPTTSNKHPRD